VIAFTVPGSVFIPFIAATLLYLNNHIPFPLPLRSNRLTVDIVLGLIRLMSQNN